MEQLPPPYAEFSGSTEEPPPPSYEEICERPPAMGKENFALCKRHPHLYNIIAIFTFCQVILKAVLGAPLFYQGDLFGFIFGFIYVISLPNFWPIWLMNYEPSHPIYRYKLKNLIMKTPYVWLFALDQIIYMAVPLLGALRGFDLELHVVSACVVVILNVWAYALITTVDIAGCRPCEHSEEFPFYSNKEEHCSAADFTDDSDQIRRLPWR